MWALAAVAARELLWGLRAVGGEVARWQLRAGAIPDAPLREDALDALIHKRENIDGAALFWTLPRRRDLRLLALLVRYETMADFLDGADERAASAGTGKGRLLQRVLTDALDPDAPNITYYGHNPPRDDGGYLHALVDACRSGCSALPAFAPVRPLALRAATLSGVQALNHEPDPARRVALLQAWAARELPDGGESSWFELTAAASAWLTVLALLALAAEPTLTLREYERISAAYLWISMTATMLDSYADLAEDAGSGGHSYISYYPSEEIAVRRAGELVRRACGEAYALHDGCRHTVLTAGMVALYLSKDSADSPRPRPRARTIICAGEPLAMLLLPVLRIWRAAYALRAA
jgi:tetraprenyl-beta-curcumene synthase